MIKRLRKDSEGKLSIPYYQVDSFAEHPLAGNPAGVCVLASWPSAERMQAIAAETSAPATAFLVFENEGWGLRWFTPLVEEEMCGHGTLAAAWVVLNRLDPARQSVSFTTRAGRLDVVRDGERFVMDLPARLPSPCAAPPLLATALGAQPSAVLRAASYIAVFEDASMIAALAPDFATMMKLDLPGVVATAPGAGFDCDVASRYFAPAKGIPEDAVTGSAHAQVIPYWSQRLGRRTLEARQLSPRGGRIRCEDRGALIRLTASAALFLSGEIEI
jgi:PhzF family phenazine biosynthesis protein